MKTTTEPTVSVIIPTYNRAEILPLAIDSVLEQSYGRIELIVVDDASTDNTPSIVERYDDERLVYLRHEQNTGHGGATRNTGLEKANGDYVAFLDDDDQWRPTKLEKQVALLEKRSQRFGLVYCWMVRYDGETVVKRDHPTHRGDILRVMLDRNAITSASTLLVRGEVIENIGRFDPAVPRGIDSDFIRRAAVDYYVDYVPEELVEYYVGHGFGRDSDWDEASIRDAIRSTRIKFEKFPDAFERHPEMYASNLAYIGTQYGMLNEWGPCVEHFQRAIRVHPATPRIWVQALRLARFHLNETLPRVCEAKARIRNR